jgi:hypothetical protein
VSLAGTVVLIGVVLAASRSKRLVIPAAGADVEGLTNILSKQVAEKDRVPLEFEDVTASSGIKFRHFPANRSSLIAEDMGSGVAWGDYDDDGLVDLLIVNCAAYIAGGTDSDRDAAGARLYRNLGGGQFDDATVAAGINFVGHGMGAAWGDYDSDGDLDLYITALGRNALYKNLGDGRFEDVTEQAGVQDKRFSSGCSWADYDRDGDVDLYVCNYIDFVAREADRSRTDSTWGDQPYTMNPSAYEPAPNSLFRNNGDGTFTDVARQAGVDDPSGRGLSASWTDFDNDLWPDLYVANDVSENAVFRNRGDGTFEDIGAASLAADYRSAMGLAVADFDDDSDQDFFITHWIAQENALYCNMLIDPSHDALEHRLWFFDAADQFGVGQITLDAVGWATGFCDFDNDGLRDLWVVNGHTFEQTVGKQRKLIPQRPFLFWNRGADGFVEVAEKACREMATPIAGRGGAQADFDNDGRVDLAWLSHQGPLLLFRNTSPTNNRWLRIELRQSGGNPRALGARAYVTCGNRTQMGEVGCSSSYLSQDELTLHFGLGSAARVDSLRIVWPDGTEETRHDTAVDQKLTIHRAAHPALAGP